MKHGKKMGPKNKPASGRDPHAGGNDSGTKAEMWQKKQLKMLSKQKKNGKGFTGAYGGKDPNAGM